MISSDYVFVEHIDVDRKGKREGFLQNPCLLRAVNFNLHAHLLENFLWKDQRPSRSSVSRKGGREVSNPTSHL